MAYKSRTRRQLTNGAGGKLLCSVSWGMELQMSTHLPGGALGDAVGGVWLLPSQASTPKATKFRTGSLAKSSKLSILAPIDPPLTDDHGIHTEQRATRISLVGRSGRDRFHLPCGRLRERPWSTLYARLGNRSNGYIACGPRKRSYGIILHASSLGSMVKGSEDADARRGDPRIGGAVRLRYPIRLNAVDQPGSAY